MGEHKPRVWLLTNTPSPYQLDLLGAVERSGEVQLSVRFLSDTHRGHRPLRKSSLSDVRVLPAQGSARLPDALHRHPAALEELRAAAHDIYVLSGSYGSRTFMQCARHLHRSGVPWAVWLEAPWPAGYRPPWATRLTSRFPLLLPVRKLALGFLSRNATMFWAIGTMAIKAYEQAGVGANRLHLLPYAADTQLLRDEPGGNPREAIGLSDKTVFLFSGSLVPRKGVDMLLEGFALLQETHPDTALVVLGDGPLRDAVAQAAQSQPNLLAAGHVEPEALPAYFHAADVFVFPSRYDGWGVVIQEACAAGLPVITTRHVGAALDLVREGVNGILVPRDSAAEMAQAMAELADNASTRARMGKASRDSEESFGLEAGVQRFVTGVKRCLERGAGA